MPEFSIVTACYDSAATVADTLRSVAAQKNVTVEHILKDGGSKDGTTDIAAQVNPRARVLVSVDRGIYDAMNQGFEAAAGEIVGFLNSDDYYSGPDVLEAVRNTFAATGCDVVYGDISMINSLGQEVRYWESGRISPRSLDGKQLPHPAWFVRRSALVRLGLPFDPSYRISADYKQQLMLVEKLGLHTVYLPKTLTIMRMGGESTKNLTAIVAGWRECLRAYREVHNRSGWLMVTRKVLGKLRQIRTRPLRPANLRA